MRAHAGEQTELEAQATELRTHRAMEVQGELRAAAFDNCQELLCDGVRLMSMLQILQLFQAGKLSAKDMEECLTAADILRGNLLSFQYQLPQIHKTVQLAAAILEVFESKPCISLMEGLVPTHDEALAGRVVFRDVHFAYPTRPSNHVLRGLSLTAEPRTLTALCGPSGGGKSTVFSLLQRLYDPVCGDVLLDSFRTSQLQPMWLRRHVALVGQEPLMFEVSIRDNLSYGMRVPPSLHALEAAAELAQVLSFVRSLPRGWDTPMACACVSGGQMQRLAVARAFVRQPLVLLLDEPSSALDSLTEKALQEAIDGVARQCTTLIITHRIRTVTHADHVVYLDEGRAVEAGTLQQLLRCPDGKFAKMFAAETGQSAEQVLEEARAQAGVFLEGRNASGTERGEASAHASGESTSITGRVARRVSQRSTGPTGSRPIGEKGTNMPMHAH